LLRFVDPAADLPPAPEPTEATMDDEPSAPVSARQRRSIVIDETALDAWLHDGMTVALGGLATACHPMLAVRHMVRRELRDLTVIGSAVGGLDLDLLIGAGCVRKVICPYVGAEALAPIGPFFRAAAERAAIEIWECDEGQYYTGLQAAAQLLPFLPCRVGVGTSFPELNPDLKPFRDPVRGEPLLAVPAISPDVALLHAASSDPFGNVQFTGTGYADRLLWRAADRTLVQVERILSNEEIRQRPERTALLASAVLKAPWGAHPFSSPGFYLEDREHIAELVEAGRALARSGDRRPFEAYLDRYIRQPVRHLEYLERIGLARLLSLDEYRG
jgi:glutaconate CoA-transferase, subunit A